MATERATRLGGGERILLFQQTPSTSFLYALYYYICTPLGDFICKLIGRPHTLNTTRTCFRVRTWIHLNGFFSCAVYPRDSVYGRRRRRDIDSTLSNILKRFCSDFPNSYNGTAAARLTRCIKSASRRPQHRRPYTIHEKKKKRKNEMKRVVRILVRQTDTLYSGRAIIIIMYLFIIFRRGGRNDRRSRYNM